MLPSGLPDDISDDEPLSRFLTSDSQFNRLMPRPSAYMPSSIDDKTSVFRQSITDLPALWAIADSEIRGDRRVRAVAQVNAADVRRARLDVQAHEPPPRHANIIGWPSGEIDRDQMKAQQKEFALLLAQSAKLVRR